VEVEEAHGGGLLAAGSPKGEAPPKLAVSGEGVPGPAACKRAGQKVAAVEEPQDQTAHLPGQRPHQVPRVQQLAHFLFGWKEIR
jgi:hypothetical protein